MHQQIRTSLGRTSVTDGVGAMDAESIHGGVIDTSRNSLDDLLGIVEGKGYRVILAGGKGLSGGGEFVFAIEHDEGDEQPIREVYRLLAEAQFRPLRMVRPEREWLEDEPGSLRRALARIEERSGKRIHEVHVGKATDGRSFVHAIVVG